MTPRSRLNCSVILPPSPLPPPPSISSCFAEARFATGGGNNGQPAKGGVEDEARKKVERDVC